MFILLLQKCLTLNILDPYVGNMYGRIKSKETEIYLLVLSTDELEPRNLSLLVVVTRVLFIPGSKYDYN
jgi:hypothetical protein